MYESQIELKSSRILEALILFTKLQIENVKEANSLLTNFSFGIKNLWKERMNYNSPAEIRYTEPSHEQLDNNALSM